MSDDDVEIAWVHVRHVVRFPDGAVLDERSSYLWAGYDVAEAERNLRGRGRLGAKRFDRGDFQEVEVLSVTDARRFPLAPASDKTWLDGSKAEQAWEAALGAVKGGKR